MRKLVIVKLGGSVITDKNKLALANISVLSRLARELGKSSVPLIVVHGAGSFGHLPVKNFGVSKGFYDETQKLGVCRVHYYCKELNQLVCDELIKNKVPAVGLPAFSLVRQKNGSLSRFNTELVKEVLSEGLVPVFFGDMTLDSTRHGLPCSGDKIIAFLSNVLEPERIVLGTDVDGVFTSDPKTDKNAKLIPLVTPDNLDQVLSSLQEAKTPDVTGGMKGKILSLLEESRKCPIIIVNALKPGRLQKAIEGKETVSTVFRLHE